MTDRWQYGVGYQDGSSAFRWCGRTSRTRAEEEIAHHRLRFFPDRPILMRRLVDERGKWVGPPELVED